jgi:hypothetical protein
MASQEEVRELIFQESDVEDYRDLWPAIKVRITEIEPVKKSPYSFMRRWAFGAAGVAVVVLLGFLFFITLSRNGVLLEPEGETGFQINSIRVGDEPATPFLYQPKDSDMILVWAEKSM